MSKFQSLRTQSVEDKWYQFWLDGKFFVANEHSAKPAYSIVIPPPNVAGVLTLAMYSTHHSGHSLPQGAHGRQGSSLVARTDHASSPRSASRAALEGRKIKLATTLAAKNFSNNFGNGRTKKAASSSTLKNLRVVRLDARTVTDGPNIHAACSACS